MSITMRQRHPDGRPHAESATVLHEVAELMPRRGLVVLVSDLFYPGEELFSGLDHFRYQGHDILVFQILDTLERRLPVEGAIRFHDLETGEELVTRAEEIRPAYQAAMDRWFGELDQECRTRELERVTLTTDEPLDRGLYSYLARRARRLDGYSRHEGVPVVPARRLRHGGRVRDGDLLDLVAEQEEPAGRNTDNG